MKCPKCGEPLEGKPEKCPKCGVKLVYKQPAQQEEKQPEKETLTLNQQQPMNGNQPVKSEEQQLPAGQTKKRNLATNRGLFKFILFSILTLGIYGIIFLHRYTRDLNEVRASYGAKKKMGFIASFFLSFITLGIAGLVWVINTVVDTYKYADRENVARGSVVLFFIFNIVLVWTIVCPLIAFSNLFKSMNGVCNVVNYK